MCACTVLPPRQPSWVQTPMPFTVVVSRGPQPACSLTVSRVEVTERATGQATPGRLRVEAQSAGGRAAQA